MAEADATPRPNNPARLIERMLAGDRLAPPTHRAPSPASVGLLGSARLRAGETVPAADLVPIYLRPSEAELKRRAVAVR